MVNPQPMDRLVCGDVGFASRSGRCARLSSAACGKAVRYLPTTLLAQQHYKTASRVTVSPSGMSKVEVMSRFKSDQGKSRLPPSICPGKSIS